MKFKLILAVLISLLATSCATYHVSTKSLYDQCTNAHKVTKITYFASPLFVFFPGIVSANSLKEFRCLDKNEKEHVIKVTSHTGMRITKKNGKKTTFYVDTIFVKDSTITGSQSHFITIKLKPIKLKDISKIEIRK